MKIRKQLFSVFLSIVFIFGSLFPSISAHATVFEWTDKLNEVFHDFFQAGTGVILAPIGGIKDSFTQWLGNSNYVPDGTSPEEWVQNNYYYNSDNDSSTGSADLINAMRDYASDYIDRNGLKYVYTSASSDYVTQFSDMDKYNAFQSIVQSLGFCAVYSSNSPNSVYVYDCDSFVYYSQMTSYGNAYRVKCYKDWTNIGRTSGSMYTYNSVSKRYELVEPTNFQSLEPCFLNSLNGEIPNGFCVFVTPTREQRIMYMTVDSMKYGSVGAQPYYVTDSYNTSHTDSSITFSGNDLSRQISYQSVNDYINSYYVTNLSYPTTQTIYNYINNYNGDNGNGNGDDNGNGNGNGNGNNDHQGFWNAVDAITSFLGNLIDALGNIVSGILDALTNFVDVLKDGIPNVIGDLIEYFLPFLPVEIITLVSLSVTFAVIIFVIKTIRGN